MTIQKNILFPVFIFSLSVMLTGVTYAQSATPEPTAATISPSPEAKKPANIEQIKKRITQKIDQRIQQLQKINDRMQKSNKLSDDIKKILAKDITVAIDKLNTYKTDVASATDIQSLMKLVSKMYEDKDFRTILNEINILERFEKFNDLYTELNTLITKVQTEVDTQKTAIS